MGKNIWYNTLFKVRVVNTGPLTAKMDKSIKNVQIYFLLIIPVCIYDILQFIYHIISHWSFQSRIAHERRRLKTRVADPDGDWPDPDSTLWKFRILQKKTGSGFNCGHSSDWNRILVFKPDPQHWTKTRPRFNWYPKHDPSLQQRFSCTPRRLPRAENYWSFFVFFIHLIWY